MTAFLLQREVDDFVDRVNALVEARAIALPETQLGKE
jgi:hypothetical protein